MKSESQLKIEKLKIATDEHFGLELLHLFILDLLGRHTPAAHIFATKSEEDFRHSQVVTRQTKLRCSLLVFALNFFFAYYSIVHGYQKGLNWQMSYLLGCVSQLVAEVLLFDTMECIWMQFLIPSLVSSEVERVNKVLSDVLDQLCAQSADSNAYASSILNAPEYLFVSANIAKANPQLMESIIVLSYQSHLPGELSHTWTHGTSSHRSSHRNGGGFRYIALLGMVLSLLQTLATAPSVLHRVFIRFSQPFFLAVLVYAGTTVIENKIYTAVTAVVIISLIGLMVYKYIRGRVHLPPLKSIRPVVSTQRVFTEDEQPIVLISGYSNSPPSIHSSSQSSGKNSDYSSSSYGSVESADDGHKTPERSVDNETTSFRKSVQDDLDENVYPNRQVSCSMDSACDSELNFEAHRPMKSEVSMHSSMGDFSVDLYSNDNNNSDDEMDDKLGMLRTSISFDSQDDSQDIASEDGICITWAHEDEEDANERGSGSLSSTAV